MLKNLSDAVAELERLKNEDPNNKEALLDNYLKYSKMTFMIEAELMRDGWAQTFESLVNAEKHRIMRMMDDV